MTEAQASLSAGVSLRERRSTGEGPAKGKSLGQEQIVLVITGLLVLGFSLLLPGFLQLGNLMAILRSISVLGILGLGMAIVVIGRGIDLSQVVVFSVSNGVAIQMLGNGHSLAAALAIGLGVAIFLGLLNGAIIAYAEVPSLFATLASGMLILGVARTTVLPSLVLNLPEDSALLVLGANVGGVPVPMLIFIGAALVVHLFLSRTTYGRFIYAHGDNADAARLGGISIRLLVLLEFALCAVIAYFGGLVSIGATALVNLNAAINSTQIFDVILVVVLGGVSLVGGRGGVLSVLAGTLLIGVLLNGMTILDMNYQLQNVIKGAVLLAAIVLDNWLHPRDDETARQGD